MALIEVREVSKHYPGEVTAVDKVSLDVNEGETLVLIGTSGSGKTTLMRMMNRLIEPSSGTIRISDQEINETDPITLRRDIGYVIQKVGLFPHMTIEDNITVVPRLKGWPQERRHKQARELLGMVGMEPDQYLNRWPAELSGGQQQRIGVARALAGDPPIILMDEPFGALDPITREQLQDEFKQLKRRIQKTIVFVTHDIFEAVNLGDRIAIMDAGKVLQLDTPENILKNPGDEFVAQFLGKHRFQLEMSTLQVEDLMEDRPVTLTYSGAEQKAQEAADLMSEKGVETLVIVSKDGKLQGLVTADGVEQAADDAALKDVMTTGIEPLQQRFDLLTATHIVANSDFDCLPVVNAKRRVVGVLTAAGLTGVFSERLNHSNGEHSGSNGENSEAQQE